MCLNNTQDCHIFAYTKRDSSSTPCSSSSGECISQRVKSSTTSIHPCRHKVPQVHVTRVSLSQPRFRLGWASWGRRRQGGRSGDDVGSGNKVTRSIRVVTELTKGGDRVRVFTRRHGYVQVVEESVTEYVWVESRGWSCGWRSERVWRVGVWREERFFS